MSIQVHTSFNSFYVIVETRFQMVTQTKKVAFSTTCATAGILALASWQDSNLQPPTPFQEILINVPILASLDMDIGTLTHTETKMHLPIYACQVTSSAIWIWRNRLGSRPNRRAYFDKKRWQWGQRGGVSIDIEATSTSSQEGEFDLKENREKKFSTRGNHTVNWKIVTTT